MKNRKNNFPRRRMRLRKILELISRNVVFKRKLPSEYNKRKIYVSPGSALHFWLPNLKKMDKNLFRVVNEFIKPNDNVWDVGANVGLFTFSSALKEGNNCHCVAIEADIVMSNLLRKTLKLHNDINVDVLPLAVSNKIGFVEFNIAVRGRATNHLSISNGSSNTGGIRESYRVPSVTLDFLLDFFNPPNFIKIDVEGAELFVLEGANNIIIKHRPSFYIEVTKQTADKIYHLFTNYNYSIYLVNNYPQKIRFDEINRATDFLIIPDQNHEQKL